MADDRENDFAQANDDDPVVAEVRRAREDLLSRFDYDIRAYCKFLQEQTEEAARAGQTVVSAPPRQQAPIKKVS